MARAWALDGDCRDVLAGAPVDSVDAVVTDPPYELAFMGKQWDGSGIANDSKVWQQCLRVLKPGGYLLAFGGTRTYHRMVCAVEDAGFEIRDSIHWVYGSGFPKSQDVGKALDRRPGVGSQRAFAEHLSERRHAKGLSRADVAERVVGARANASACWNWEHHQFPQYRWWQPLQELLGLDPLWGDVLRNAEREVVAGRQRSTTTSWLASGIGDPGTITAPATDAAKCWQGWGTALKPAHEPIVVARKPLWGTVAANVLRYGTGAINVDGCRVGKTTTQGRWPSNLILTHDPDCADACVDACAVREMDGQSGNRPAGNYPAMTSQRQVYGGLDGYKDPHGPRSMGDSGGASRFFPVFRYTAKASRKERPQVEGVSPHPTVKPLELMRWLVRLVTPPGGVVLDPFTGSGTTLEAAVLEGFDSIGIELMPEYRSLIEARLERCGILVDA